MALALFLVLVMDLNSSNRPKRQTTYPLALHMSLHRLTRLVLLTSSLLISSATPAWNQTPTNQSDVTGANPIEVIPSNQSDETGVIPTELTNSESGRIDGLPTIDRPGFETAFAEADLSTAVLSAEELSALEFQIALGLPLFGAVPTLASVTNSLSTICQKTGERTAVIYAVPLEKELQLIGVFPNCPQKQSALPQPSWLTATLDFPSKLLAQQASPEKLENSVRKSVPDSNRKNLETTIKTLRRKVSDPRLLSNQTYFPAAQQLYKWLIQPLKPELENNKIDNLVFTMGTSLRSLPIAALHNGEKFLVEEYSVAQIPSFGLTDTRLRDVRDGKALAMGASEFKSLNPLPGVPAELQSVVTTPNLAGQDYLNQEFTLQRFTELNQKERFAIVHLATHGEFRPGSLNRSYIQMWDQRLTLPELQAFSKSVGWTDPNKVPVELLVLSACKTAIGDSTAELGFAGLMLATGVKSTLASLWNVSDLGTLALMTEFYDALGKGAGKAAALRQAQLQLLQGKVRIEQGKLTTASGRSIPLPPELAQQTDLKLNHPYFWSAFMLFGNWH
jgi:CHAT domain-containing protein